MRPDAVNAALGALKAFRAAVAGPVLFDVPGFPEHAHVSSNLIDPRRVWQRRIAPFGRHGSPAADMQRDMLDRRELILDFPYYKEGSVASTTMRVREPLVTRKATLFQRAEAGSSEVHLAKLNCAPRGYGGAPGEVHVIVPLLFLRRVPRLPEAHTEDDPATRGMTGSSWRATLGATACGGLHQREGAPSVFWQRWDVPDEVYASPSLVAPARVRSSGLSPPLARSPQHGIMMKESTERTLNDRQHIKRSPESWSPKDVAARRWWRVHHPAAEEQEDPPGHAAAGVGRDAEAWRTQQTEYRLKLGVDWGQRRRLHLHRPYRYGPAPGLADEVVRPVSRSRRGSGAAYTTCGTSPPQNWCGARSASRRSARCWDTPRSRSRWTSTSMETSPLRLSRQPPSKRPTERGDEHA